jgi:tetratricopeptide (TPR) repeat protein
VGGNRPGAGGGAGGIGPTPGGDRPSIGMTKPAPGFERPVRPEGPGGGGNRPGSGGNRPGGGLGQGGGFGSGSGNRPGFGGDRPSIGMTKPAPGFERPVRPEGPGSGGNRPGIGGNRPGIGGNRPGGWGDGQGGFGNRPGGNRPGGNWWNNVGNDNSIHNNWFQNNQNWFTNVNNNQVNINRPWGGGYGGWGLGGYGYGGGYRYGGYWRRNYVNPGYGWYNGCWYGNWGSNWWAPFALGAATTGLLTTCSNWGLGYASLGYGGGYVNPYYAAIPATVVAASPYDYSQPLIVNNYLPAEGQAADDGGAAADPAAEPTSPPSETEVLVEKALAAFKSGDYASALAGLDRAVKLSPEDSVVHEVRALALFALGRYPEAAAVLNAVLAAAPGMDWTTLSGLYGDVDDYTVQLRRLEAACRENPSSAANYFVLAYHYLVGGHADLAADCLGVVVREQPGDAVAKRLLEAITPDPEATPSRPEAEPNKPAGPADAGAKAAAPAEAEAESAGPETDLVGRWKAAAGDDTIELAVNEDFSFSWKATPKGQPPVELSGTLSTSADAIALESEKAGTMVAKVKSRGPDAFEFTLAGAPAEAPPLRFERQK